MSNYSPINFDTNFTGPKNKFVTKTLEKIPEIDYSIENETKLSRSTLFSKNKIENNNFSRETQLAMKGPGRGFGNLNISNEIRNSNNSREDSKEYKEQRESMQIFDYQFQYLDKNFQDPSHIVMPIPRGGVTTRDQIQLEVDSMRGDIQQEKPKKFEFNY